MVIQFELRRLTEVVFSRKKKLSATQLSPWVPSPRVLGSLDPRPWVLGPVFMLLHAGGVKYLWVVLLLQCSEGAVW